MFRRKGQRARRRKTKAIINNLEEKVREEAKAKQEIIYLGEKIKEREEMSREKQRIIEMRIRNLEI
ncbi:6083_t:CDS:1, partial [Funneliformis mosseae]